ncbi:sulfatase [Haloferula rosea]|nr:sulfatase [Haloferula rosea]
MKPLLQTILAAFSLTLVPSSGSTQQPNILFIAIDDLNDWIGCMGGHPQAHTPNIDRLAARGMLFTNAHCASPACQPSRAAVFTGMMPEKTGVWTNGKDSLSRMMPEAIKLPIPFERAGYRAMGTGKLIHDTSDRDHPAVPDYVYVEQRWSPIPSKQARYTKEALPTKGSNNPRHLVTDSLGRQVVLPLNRMPSDRAPEKLSGESFDWGPWDVPDSDFGDTRITDWAISKLEEEDDAPLFLALGYYRPHIPLWAPKRFFDRFKEHPGQLPPVKEDDLDDLGETGKKWAREAVTAGAHASVVKHDQWSKAVEGYLACTTYVDHEIGRLLDALDESSYRDNTIVVLWSDHGWHLGEKEHWGKWTGWERSTKVPLIIAPPRSQAGKFAPAGSSCNQPVGLIDLYPTLTDLCGVKPPEGLDGQSLAPLLRNPDQKTGRKLVTVFDKGNHSVRTERWRYILYQDGEEELYDHQGDPHEWNNLASNPEYRSLMNDLRRGL